jgi:hypothetical protein
MSNSNINKVHVRKNLLTNIFYSKNAILPWETTESKVSPYKCVVPNYKSPNTSNVC